MLTNPPEDLKMKTEQERAAMNALESLLGDYWNIAYAEGLDQEVQGYAASETLSAIRQAVRNIVDADRAQRQAEPSCGSKPAECEPQPGLSRMDDPQTQRQAEPVGTLCVTEWRGMKNTEFQQELELPAGQHKLYAAPPPAQVPDARDAEMAALRQDAGRWRFLREDDCIHPATDRVPEHRVELFRIAGEDFLSGGCAVSDYDATIDLCMAHAIAQAAQPAVQREVRFGTQEQRMRTLEDVCGVPAHVRAAEILDAFKDAPFVQAQGCLGGETAR
jgi:hypothetical protein